MKQVRKILALLQAILLLAGMVLSVHAAGKITPYYNNTYSATTIATVSEDGLLEITNLFEADPEKMSTAFITTYVEKKVLGLFWTRVELGNENNEWIDAVFRPSYAGTHSVQLTSSGTYRVIAKFEINSVNATDEIVCTDQVTY